MSNILEGSFGTVISKICQFYLTVLSIIYRYCLQYTGTVYNIPVLDWYLALCASQQFWVKYWSENISDFWNINLSLCEKFC
jgi:hypothetical protein